MLPLLLRVAFFYTLLGIAHQSHWTDLCSVVKLLRRNDTTYAMLLNEIVMTNEWHNIRNAVKLIRDDKQMTRPTQYRYTNTL